MYMFINLCDFHANITVPLREKADFEAKVEATTVSKSWVMTGRIKIWLLLPLPSQSIKIVRFLECKAG